MSNLKKNIARKRNLAKRENVAMRTSSSKNPLLDIVVVKAGSGMLKETIEKIQVLRKEHDSKNPSDKLSKGTPLYHKYGKNSIRTIKVF